MNPSDSSSNFITRRDFMKKSALTVGAITLLSQGIGLAGEGSSSNFSGTGCPPTDTATNTGTFNKRRTDTWREYVHTNGFTFWKRYEGNASVSSGVQPPGHFDEFKEKYVTGHKCIYKIAAEAPSISPTSGSWTIVGGNTTIPSSSNAGDTLPSPESAWTYNNSSTTTDYAQTTSWTAVQKYTLDSSTSYP